MFIPGMASKPVHWSDILRFTITLKRKVFRDLPKEYLIAPRCLVLADYH